MNLSLQPQPGAATPAQPNLPQYPISDLYLFPNYADRAVYAAAVGKQAPPFNPALPIKGWQGSGSFLVFDAAAGGAVAIEVPDSAATVNLPGIYDYPPFVEVPTDAVIWGPYGPAVPVGPITVSMEADAHALAAALSPVYPGKSVTVMDASQKGIYYTVYGLDPRRQWAIAVAGVNIGYAQGLIEASSKYGVGAPGHWAIAPIPGPEGAKFPPVLTWVQDPQATTAPANALTLPVPIRPLLPNEQFELVPPSNPLFGTAAWMVVRTDIQQAITLAEVQQLVAQYNAQPGVTAIAVE